MHQSDLPQFAPDRDNPQRMHKQYGSVALGNLQGRLQVLDCPDDWTYHEAHRLQQI
jgi:hypothetical protein